MHLVHRAIPRLERIVARRRRGAAREQCTCAGKEQRGATEQRIRFHFLVSPAGFSTDLTGAAASPPAPPEALSNRNWLISFSMTTADCVLRMRSPSLSISGS